MRRKFRSVLTGIGVAVAIAAVVALLGVSEGFQRSMAEVYETRGVDLMVVRAGVAQPKTSKIDENFLNRIEQLPNVARVTPTLTEMAKFSADDVVGNTLHGWRPESNLFDALIMVSGTKIAPGSKYQIMLGEALAKKLNKKVGDPVPIINAEQDFTCVGIFQTTTVFESASAVVALSDLQMLKDMPDLVNEFQVVLKPDLPDKEAAIAELKEQIEQLTSDDGKRLGLAATTTNDFVRGNSQIMLARAMAWVTSGIALVIGSVGVLNTMIMSVLERTQEIGILRAIGWRRRRIVRMVLSESFAISLLGAVIGIAVAVMLTRSLSALPQLEGKVRGDISMTAVGIGLLMAVSVGLIGGVYPAVRGANLPPTEALRYE